MSQFEVTEASAAVAGTAAAAARSVLSDEFVNSGKNPVTGDKPADTPKHSDSSTPAQTVGEALAQAVSDAVKSKPTESGDSSPAQGLGNLLKDSIKNGIGDGARALPDVINKGGRIWDGGSDNSIRYFEKTVTDKNRAEAKEALGQGLSELIPEADRKILTTMQGALIDGNLDKLKGALGSLSGDPVRMEKFLKEINGQLKREGASLELTNDGKGNVLVYNQFGNTAVSINAKTGETTLRAIERQNDGSILLKPGEIINRKPEEVMKNMGDEATRDITGMNYRFHKYIDPGYKIIDELHHKVPHSGGGGGGDSSLKNSQSLKESMKQLENLLPKEKKVK